MSALISPWIVSQVIGGTNVSVSPSLGTGVVTVTGSVASPSPVGSSFPNGWGSYLKTALASSGSTLVNIAVIGDSITMGYFASDFLSTNYVSILRAGLQSTYGNGGSGFLSSYNSNYVASYTSTQSHAAVTGAWSTALSVGGPASTAKFTNSIGATMTFTNIVGTIITVYYARDPTVGSFTIKIDGGSPSTVNATGSSATLSFAISGQTTSPHTVLITDIGGGTGDTTTIYGVRGTNTTGVTVDNFGISAQTSGGFIGTAFGDSSAWSGGQFFPASLVIYALGVNDSNNQTGAAASSDVYAERIIQNINTIRDFTGGLGNTDYLVMFPHIGQWQSTGPSYYEMMSRIESMCVSSNIAFVSIAASFQNSWQYGVNQSYFGNSAVVTGAAGTDLVHPGNTGHAFIGNLLNTLIRKFL